MQGFIVLGLIPGTHIQITFAAWLCAVSIGLTAWMVRKVYRSETLAGLLIAANIALQTRRAL